MSASVIPTFRGGKVRMRVDLDRDLEARIKARATESVHERFGWARLLISASGGILTGTLVILGAELAAAPSYGEATLQLPLNAVLLVAAASGLIIFSYLQFVVARPAAGTAAIVRQPLLPVWASRSDEEDWAAAAKKKADAEAADAVKADRAEKAAAATATKAAADEAATAKAGAVSDEDLEGQLARADRYYDKGQRALKKHDAAEGVRQHRKALRILTSIHPSNHRDVLQSQQALGAALKMVHGSKAVEAHAEGERYLRTAYAGWLATLGPTAPQALNAGATLAGLLRMNERFADAVTMYEELVSNCTAGLGPEHPRTLQFRSSLGSSLDACGGREKEAMTSLRGALDGQRKALGEVHEATLSTQGSLALMVRKLCREGAAGAKTQADGNAEAEELYRDMLAKSRKALGDEHRITLAVINNLGVLLRETKRLEETEKLYREALATKRHVFGDKAGVTLNTLGNLANLLQEMGQYSEAQTLFAEEVDTRTQIGRGLSDPYVLVAMRNLGTVMQLNGEDGEGMLRKALAAATDSLGSDDEVSVEIARALAALLNSLPDGGGRKEEAAAILKGLPAEADVHAHTADMNAQADKIAAIESTFEVMGVAAAFQSVFHTDDGKLDTRDHVLHATFAKVDTDGSGTISADEMQAYIHSVFGKALDDDVLDDMMRAADSNGDGLIDVHDFTKMMKSADTDGDGQLSAEEIANLAA